MVQLICQGRRAGQTQKGLLDRPGQVWHVVADTYNTMGQGRYSTVQLAVRCRAGQQMGRAGQDMRQGKAPEPAENAPLTALISLPEDLFLCSRPSPLEPLLDWILSSSSGSGSSGKGPEIPCCINHAHCVVRTLHSTSVRGRKEKSFSEIIWGMLL